MWGSLCFVPPPLCLGTLAGAVPGSAFGGWECVGFVVWSVGWLFSSLGGSCLWVSPQVPLCPPTLSPQELGRSWGPTHCQTDALPAKPGCHPTLPPSSPPLLTSPLVPPVPTAMATGTRTLPKPAWHRAGGGQGWDAAEMEQRGMGQGGRGCLSCCRHPRSGVMHWEGCSRAMGYKGAGHGSVGTEVWPPGRAGRAQHLPFSHTSPIPSSGTCFGQDPSVPAPLVPPTLPGFCFQPLSSR